MANQNPEQLARDRIDAQLRASGWAVQDKDAIDFTEGEEQAVREYTTDSGPADYVLFLDRKPVGITEAKKETLGQPFNESQTAFLQLIRDHIMTSIRFERDDLDFAPFDAQGGLGKMHQLFGDSMDALIAQPSKTLDLVLTNPPFGKKSSMTFTNEEGEQEKDDLTYNRQDFWATTSNKQLNSHAPSVSIELSRPRQWGGCWLAIGGNQKTSQR